MHDHAHETAYAISRGDRIIEAFALARPGVLAGVTTALLVNATPLSSLALASSGAALAMIVAFFRPRAIDCSLCDETLAAAAGRCPNCAAAIRGRR